MNLKTFISLVVAASLGLAAVWVGRQLIFGQSLASMPGAAMTKVVVAKKDLDPGQQIALADLSVVDMPVASAPTSAFKDPEKVKGRTLLSAVVKGQVMFDALLAGEGVDGGLTALVPKGMRAVSVEVSESSGLAGLLLPGCRVDVIATLKQDSGQMAKTIVENAKVQAIGVKLSKKPGEEKTTPAKTVTLIVTTKDAEAIELASNSGKPRLVLRGLSDTDRSAGPGVTFAELSGAAIETSEVPAADAGGWDRFFAALMNRPIPPSEAAQPVRWPVQIIRGNSESTIFYEVSAKSVELADRSLLASPQQASSPERPNAKN